jgi:hypothetical protein
MLRARGHGKSSTLRGLDVGETLKVDGVTVEPDMRRALDWRLLDSRGAGRTAGEPVGA